jgi:hypothetical protein
MKRKMKVWYGMVFFVAAISSIFAQNDVREGLAIKVIGKDFGKNDKWILGQIQNALANNFMYYSNFAIVDLEHFAIFEEELEKQLQPSFPDDGLSITKSKNYRYMLISDVIKKDNQFFMSLSITDIETKIKIAQSSKVGTDWYLLIQDSSEEILNRLGKDLRNLVASAQDTISLPKKQNNNYDINIIPAITDIESRDTWIKTFKECAKIFEEHDPFEIVYNPKLSHIINGNEIVLSTQISLEPSSAHFKLLNDILSSLEKTGKRGFFKFNGWPFLPIESDEPDARVLGGKKSFDYTIDFTVVNQNGKKIDSQSVTLTTAPIIFSSGDKRITMPITVSKDISFKPIRYEDLINSMSVKIVKINGRSFEDIFRENKITIRLDTDLDDKINSTNGITEENGAILSYSGQTKNVFIPEMKTNSPITIIKNKAFEKKGLLKLTIPNTVTTIEDRAFYNNYLTNVTFPNSVTTIGSWTFAKNRLREVTIPNNIKKIDDWAFFQNRIKKITISSNVILGENAFDDGFAAYYNGSNRRSAGTFIFLDGTWTRN